MAVNISNINDLIIGEKAGVPSTWSNMGSETQIDCHNFKLSGESICNGLAAIDLFLEIPAFDPVGYVKNIKSIELSPGKDLETWKSLDPRIIFTIYGDESLHNLLRLLEAHETVTFTNIGQGIAEETLSMTVEASPDGALLQFKITLSFVDSETITTICCGSYYDGAPFNECDGEGETGDPSNDPECTDYSVAISLTTPPDTLTAVSALGGAGVETFKWYKDGVLFGTGSSINPVESATYRVDAKKGNCTATDTFTFSLGCDGYAVTIEEVVLADLSSVFIAIATTVSTYQWEEEIAAVWTAIVGETGITYTPSASGTFRVVSTAGDCESTSASVVYVAPVDCDTIFTITLTNVAGVLTTAIVGYAGVSIPAYQWYLDTGNGNELLVSETSATIANPAAGYYTVIVTIDSCTQVAGLLIQCDYASIDTPCADDSEWSQEFIGNDVAVSFTVTNFLLPDPAHVTAVEINASLLVQVNGVTRGFLLVPLDGTKYGIDYPNQQIELNAGFPLLTGETLTIIKLRWIQT